MLFAERSAESPTHFSNTLISNEGGAAVSPVGGFNKHANTTGCCRELQNEIVCFFQIVDDMAAYKDSWAQWWTAKASKGPGKDLIGPIGV